jgi:hypothetical protein
VGSGVGSGSGTSLVSTGGGGGALVGGAGRVKVLLAVEYWEVNPELAQEVVDHDEVVKTEVDEGTALGVVEVEVEVDDGVLVVDSAVSSPPVTL